MNEIERYRSLALTTGSDELAVLLERLRAHLAQLDKPSAYPDFAQFELGRLLVKRFFALVADPTALDPEQRACLRGGADFFLLTDGADDELCNPIVLEGDVRVFNQLCEDIDRPDLRVSLPS